MCQIWTTTDFYFWVIASYFDGIKIEDGQRWCAVWACSRNIYELFRLGKEAHKAKSSVAILGMQEVVEELKKLEILAKSEESPDQYPEIVETFATICQLAIEELDEIIPTL